MTPSLYSFDLVTSVPFSYYDIAVYNEARNIILYNLFIYN